MILQIKGFYNEWVEKSQKQAIKLQAEKNDPEFKVEDRGISA